MKNKILWLITLLPALVTVMLLPYMEEKVPMHFDLSGNIDRWGSKYEHLIVPVLIIAFSIFWSVVLKSFKKKQHSGADEKDMQAAKANEKVVYAAAFGMAVLFDVMQGFMLYTSFSAAKDFKASSAVDISMVINIVIAVFIIVTGRFMRKAKRNKLVGFRTVWSMKNDRTWEESNRFAGYSFEIAGAVIIVISMLTRGIFLMLAVPAVILVDAAVCTVYSYYIYKKNKE